MKKKGFTLSELLVVVVIIGVLSAVVLPKFSKVIETRKTTEAEELMSAVRTEQEARCTLSKKYADVSTLGSYRAGKNFSYGNEDKNLGMIATASNNKYKLEMPSYADGRICCSDIETGACNNLNKNYPLCSNLVDTSKTPDYVAGNEDCGIEIEEGKETPTEPEEEECVSGTTEERSCSNNCGETGTQKNQCIGGKWQGWGACSVSDKESCGNGPTECGEKPTSERDCGCGYKQYSWWKCDETTNYQWEIQTGSNVMGSGHSVGNDGWTTCTKPANKSRKYEECPGNLQLGSDANGNWIKAYAWYEWSDDSCSWEEVGGCCEKHDSYSEDCPNGQSGKIWYTFNYNTCKYEKSSETCGNGVWGPREKGELYRVYSGYCVGNVTSNQYYANKSNTVDTDQKYKEIEAEYRNLYPACPAGTYEGAKVPAGFTDSICLASFSDGGRACPSEGTTAACINGYFDAVAGPYSDVFGTTCNQTGSNDCSSFQGFPKQVCVMPYTFYIYRVIK